MKTLIVYASKTGVTQACAEYIASKQKEVTLCSAKKAMKVNLASYDLIILGSPVYMGSPLKAMTKFVLKRKDELLKKDIALYTTGLDQDKTPRDYLEPKYGLDVSLKSKAFGFFYTEVRLEKMNFIFRAIMKKITTEKNIDPKIDFQAIDVFMTQVF